MNKDKFYITTPIYYPSDKLHIGHAYTTTVADSLARWHKFCGRNVFFLTGSDEHGQKIQRIAKAKGVSPKRYVDKIVASFKELWQLLNIEYDEFIRTTDEDHIRAVQEVFKRIYAKGDIYKSTYQGWYCTPCESFWLENRLEDGKCPDCQRSVELVEEESYFFKLGKYQNQLLDHIRNHPEFIQPESRRNEMINFIRSGLEDLCVSRTTFDWGIPVPIDENHVIYVWFDALTNYLTAVGFPDNQKSLSTWWPADLHLVGKEIMRFHTIIWPIILLALELPLPKTVFGHGWLLFDDDKMSKSKGNVIDPKILCAEFGVDAIRYFLLREISFGQDGNFNRRALIERINADLANDLGNLLNRSLAMLNKYFAGVVPTPNGQLEIDGQLRDFAVQTEVKLKDFMDKLAINDALAAIWQLVGRANKYIDETAPWVLAKNPADEGRLATVMYNLIEVQRIIALLIKSFIPETGEKIWEQLGIKEPLINQTLKNTDWGGLRPGISTRKGDPIFPRIETEIKKKKEIIEPVPEVALENIISIDEFARIELVVGRVVTAEPIKKADKLLKLLVDMGTEKRQIVAGIAQHYQPDDLMGKNVIVVANLKPVKLRGELSQGMLLAATSEDGVLEVVSVSDQIKPGSGVR